MERFHEIKVVCPQCKKEAAVNHLKFSIKGSIKIEALCVLCGIPLVLDTTWEEIVIYCAQQEAIQQATVFEPVTTIQ